MDISEYRAQFASFNSSLELTRYQAYIGLTPDFSTDQLYDRYSGLFSASAIVELKSQLEETSAERETELNGLVRLLGAAQTRFVERKAKDPARELERCEAGTLIQWKSESIPLKEMPARIASEPNKDARAELSRAWLRSNSECDDLRQSQLEILNEFARSLGFGSYRHLSFETTGSHLDRARALTFMQERTESSFGSALADLLSREFPELRPDELTFADLLYLQSQPWIASRMHGLDYFQIQAEMISGLGIGPSQIRTDRIDPGPRRTTSVCFPVCPPTDVRLAVLPTQGAMAFLQGMESFGTALFYQWCSPTLVPRNPEFVFSSDSSTRQANGYLFRYLAVDPRWVFEFIPRMNEEQALRRTRDIALDLAIKVRSLIADALCLTGDNDDDRVDDRSQRNYADLRQRATALRSLRELCLMDLRVTEQPVVQLRALAFSFALREQLRVRYGYRWWASRKAGAELVDLWNTSSRYSVEELASEIGFGELDFDLLAEAVNAALRGT